MAGFLYFQSEYSLLKSMIKLEDMADMSLKAGYDKIYLSDDNNLYAAYKFFKHVKTPIKKVIGMKIDLVHMQKKTCLLAYAKNDLGYQNLIILSSLVNLSKERIIDFKDLIKYQESLIFVTPGFESDIDQALLKSEFDLALALTLDYKQALSDFYIGLSLQTLKQEMVVAPLINRLANSQGIHILPVHKTNYLKHQQEAFDALIKIDDPNKARFDDGDYSFKTYDELKQLFSEYPFVFDNLNKAFSKVDFNLNHKTFELPKVLDDKTVISDLYLKDLCLVGLRKRYKQGKWANPDIYKERLDFELKTIHNMGYDDYFLVVWDFVKYAKQHGIMVGPGRGSAAGSLVSYCLGITDVDPIKYDLLFERFLNPERISMPDIDLDFPDNRRDEVIKYVAEKYGKKRVLSITTFSTLQVKSSIRDICRTQNLSMNDTNRIVKLATSATSILDPSTQKILDLAKQIEGLPRQTGTHAAGIILSNEDLSRIIPFQTGASDLYQSQFEASDLESLGLLKIDFLGIRNLSIITDVLKLLKDTKSIDIDILNIPFDDSKTYDLLSRADTQGVFQLESVGMRRVLTKLKPNTFEDVVALLALFRPGPMDNIDVYIERRNGKPFSYIDPALKSILKPTYGIIIYQEQIMKIANEFANYTLAEADLLRRGVSKKNHDILENERIKFVKKSVLNGKTEALANKIYDYIVKFADYGFNRSHSVAYAIVAYQMAYLKANYFDAFMTTLLSSVTSSVEAITNYIDQLKKASIQVLPPDVNQTDFEFKLTDKGVIYPLIAIKNVGSQTVQKVKEAREVQPFKDYDDFKARLKGELKEPVMNALIFSGALDGFKLNRKTLFEKRNVQVDAYELFVSDIVSKTFDEYDLGTLIEKEKEVLGFNLQMSPFMQYETYIKDHQIDKLQALSTHSHQTIGYIKKINEIITKTKQEMAFLEVTDGSVTLEMTMFSNTYQTYKGKIELNKVYKIQVRPNDYGGLKFIIERLEHIK